MFVLQRIWSSLPGPYDYLSRTATSEPAPQKPFRLLDLPPELRNVIYDFVFAGHRLFIPALHPEEFHHVAPALLLSCKQVYTEAILTYYNSALFYVQYPPDLVWFVKIAERFQQAVTCVRICGFRINQAEVGGEIAWCFEKMKDAGVKLKREAMYVGVFSDDKKGMIWTNEFGGGGQETVAELDEAYNRSRLHDVSSIIGEVGSDFDEECGKT